MINHSMLVLQVRVDGWCDPTIKHLLRLWQVNEKAVNEYIKYMESVMLYVCCVGKCQSKKLDNSQTWYFFVSKY